MIGAAQFDQLSTPVVNLYERFAISVLEDIARRLSGLDMSLASAAWQVQRLSEAGMVYTDIINRLAKMQNLGRKELRATFKEAGVKTMLFDDAIYTAAGLYPLPLNLSPAMLDVLLAGLRKTQGVVENLVQTTANYMAESFIQSADLAYMQVSTGTMSYGQAIKAAVIDLVEQDVKVIHYPSGHQDKIDVAVRRAVLTGVAQTTGELQLTRVEEMGCELIAVSAHIGARNQGEGPKNHESWQGKVYYVGFGSGINVYRSVVPASKYSGKYAEFYSTTGYGTGEGLNGWNCRHSFYPFYEGLSQIVYTQEVLDAYKDKRVVYNGKEMSIYEATQIQRKIEREIRKQKRLARALIAAGQDTSAEQAAIKGLQAEMRDFIRQTGLVRQYDREGGGVDYPKTDTQSEIEDKLLNATWVKAEDTARTKGYFDSRRVEFSDGSFALMKRSPSKEKWGGGIRLERLSMHEAAVYELSRDLGLNVVQPTMFRIDEDASFAEYVLDAEMGKNISFHDNYFVPANMEEFSYTALLDYIIGNTDRHGSNWMIAADGHFMAIDNGLSFPLNTRLSSSKFINYLKNEILDAVCKGTKFRLDSTWKNKLLKFLEEGYFNRFSDKWLTDDEALYMLDRINIIIDTWDNLFWW